MVSKKKYNVTITNKQNPHVKESVLTEAYSPKQARTIQIILNGKHYKIGDATIKVKGYKRGR